MFIVDSEDVEKACGQAMTKFLECVFPDLLKPPDEDKERFKQQIGLLHKIFLTPLKQNMQRASAQNCQNAGSAYCLHAIIKLLLEKHPHMVDASLLSNLTHLALSTNTHETHYVEMLRDILQFTKSTSFPLHEYLIEYAIKSLDTQEKQA